MTVPYDLESSSWLWQDEKNSADSIGLPSISTTCRFAVSSGSGNPCWLAKSSAKNAMRVAPLSIRACVGISWSFTVNVQVITKCFPSIVPSNTFTLQTDIREIPEHFIAFNTQLCLSTEEPSLFNWLAIFPIPWSLSQLLLSFLLLEPAWMSESSSSPHNMPPCGYTHNSTNTSHMYTSVPSLQQKSSFVLC